MSALKRSRLSRREFGKAAATAAALSVVPGWIAATENKPPVAKTQETKPAAEGQEAPSAEAVALGEIVRGRYGSRLDASAVKEITRGIDGNLKGAAALRKISLANGDEPAFVFRAWRAPRAR